MYLHFRTTAMLILLFLNGSCKKPVQDSIKDQFDKSFYVKKSETELLGKLVDNSTYTLEVKKSNLIFVPNKDFGAYAFGDLIKINDKKILCVSSRFHTLDDFGQADFVSKTSDNNGDNWNSEVHFKANMGGINIMSPNLLRIDQNKVMFVYLNKPDRKTIDIYMQTSSDNANTFGEPKKISTVHGYQVLNNARIVRLKRGRIILPISILDANGLFQTFCYYSDNSGETWQTSSILSSDISLMEPSVVELGNGDLLMTIRTKEGAVYFSKSTDKGKTWANLYHSELVSPESPSTILSYKNKLLIFWNETKYVPNNYRNRSPLNMAISEDNGQTWNMVGKLETDLNFQYSYVSAFVENDEIYITYYKMPKQDDKSQLVFSVLKLKKK